MRVITLEACLINMPNIPEKIFPGTDASIILNWINHTVYVSLFEIMRVNCVLKVSLSNIHVPEKIFHGTEATLYLSNLQHK